MASVAILKVNRARQGSSIDTNRGLPCGPLDCVVAAQTAPSVGGTTTTGLINSTIQVWYARLQQWSCLKSWVYKEVDNCCIVSDNVRDEQLSAVRCQQHWLGPQMTATQ